MSEVTGAQERKRRLKAMPPSDEPFPPSGCVITLLAGAGFFALFGFIFSALPLYLLALLFVVGLAILLSLYLKRLAVLERVHEEWTPRGIRCLLVHSRSPVWEEHIASQWIPRLGDVAAKLDWSERSKWGESLETKVFREFCGQVNFNPAVVVFRGLRNPLVFRFFEAFHQAKTGRRHYLEELEAEMFEALGV